jgi:hypothetical protein
MGHRTVLTVMLRRMSTAALAAVVVVMLREVESMWKKK